MKKIILGLISVSAILLFAGCSEKENIKLDLDKISSELDTLTTEEIDIQGIYPEQFEIYGTLEYVYDFAFQEKLSLNKELVTAYNVNYNDETKELLAIFKPAEGKAEQVKNELNNFMTSINAKLEETNGLLIYVNCSDNDAVINKIKQTKTPVFGMLTEVPKSDMKDLLSIEETDVEEFLMKMPTMMVQSDTYIIVKPVDGKEEVVENALNEYMTKLENQWSTYLPEQYELVKNRKVEKIGDYLIYIVSSNNDLVFNTISNNKVTE